MYAAAKSEVAREAWKSLVWRAWVISSVAYTFLVLVFYPDIS